MAQYINGVKVKKTQYSIKFSGKTEEFIQQIQEVTNEKGYFNLEIKERREPDKFGNTHYVQVDEYKPKEQHEDSPW